MSLHRDRCLPQGRASVGLTHTKPGRPLFGNGASFWVNLQRIHDLALAERTVDVSGIPTLEAQTG